jgi:hypothetical protein
MKEENKYFNETPKEKIAKRIFSFGVGGIAGALSVAYLMDKEKAKQAEQRYVKGMTAQERKVYNAEQAVIKAKQLQMQKILNRD